MAARRACAVFANKVKFRSSEISPLPLPRCRAWICESGNYIYCGGGYSLSYPYYITEPEVFRYSISGNTWVQLASMPYPVAELSSIYHNEKIYCFGGNTGYNRGEIRSNKVQIYDIVSNTWSYGTSMSVGLSGVLTVLSNGIAYMFGGWNGTTSTDAVSSYNLNTNAWTDGLSNYPRYTKNELLMGVSINNTIYVFGGYIVQSPTASNRLSKYNVLTDSWESLADIPYALAECAYGIIDNKIFIVKENNLAYTYNINDNAWDVERIEYTSFQLFCMPVSKNDGIYIIGGNNPPNALSFYYSTKKYYFRAKSHMRKTTSSIIRDRSGFWKDGALSHRINI